MTTRPPQIPPHPGDVRMKGFRVRADVDEVRRMLETTAAPLPDTTVAVADCAGRILATDVKARVDVPGFQRAAMDGYAVQATATFGAAADNPLPFRLRGQVLPGRSFSGSLGPGEVIRIMTGAPLPAAADAIVPAEFARETGDGVQIFAAVTPGKHVGTRGEDVKAGTQVLASGRCLRPQDAGLLASLGVSPVPVVQRPQVDLVITGDELLPPGERPREGRIVDSNSVMLAALVPRDGGCVTDITRVADTAAAVRQVLEESRAQVVLVSGGSSVGLEDHAPQVVRTIGRLPVHGVAMRPASPTGVGFLPPLDPGGAERPVFLLPGNPVSCLCAYDFFAGPVIRRLGGRPFGWPHRTRSLPLAQKVVSKVGRVDYLRARIDAGQVEPLAISGAAILSSTVRADGFVIIHRDLEGHAPGETVTVYLYD